MGEHFRVRRVTEDDIETLRSCVAYCYGIEVDAKHLPSRASQLLGDRQPITAEAEDDDIVSGLAKTPSIGSTWA